MYGGDDINEFTGVKPNLLQRGGLFQRRAC